jgi:hypothetical protein
MTEVIEKKMADFYIYQEIEGDKDKIVGSVYLHGKGKGFNIKMGSKIFKCFPNKKKEQPATGESA